MKMLCIPSQHRGLYIYTTLYIETYRHKQSSYPEYHTGKYCEVVWDNKFHKRHSHLSATQGMKIGKY